MKEEIKIHLGCGKRYFPGWKHFDMGNYPHLDGNDITKLPFKDNSVDIVYASHVLEYFDRQEVIPVLREWNRVLQKGGLLRLAVPDFYALSQAYRDNRCSLDQILGPLFGKITPLGQEQVYHKTTYDFPSLKKLVTSNGFRNVRTYDCFETEHSMIDDQSMAHLPNSDFKPTKDRPFDYNGYLISLNIEANKK